MNKRTLAKLSGFAIAAATTATLIGLAATGTGAYFTDSKAGTITGTVGSIKVTGFGGTGANGLDLAFTNLLPGEPQHVNSGYTNTGLNPEDVWVVFNNADALHALNDLGHYGQVHISVNGATEIFASVNLNDNTSGTCPNIPTTDCRPVPQKILVQSNLGPGGSGYWTFQFNYSTLLSGQTPAGGGVWNAYPLPTATAPNAGLPYQIVATQVGQTP